MNHPRVLIRNQSNEMLECESLEKFAAPFADVLIVCGQGVYEDGIYYGEFHDRDVCFEHSLKFPEIAGRFRYNIIVLSGGFTQERAPWLSEAESFLNIMRDAGVEIPPVPLILDEYALDSAENILLGLMTTRLALSKTPIRRVGIWVAWKFKKWRFNRNAEALGIVEQTYVHGFAHVSDTNIQVPIDDAKQRDYNEYMQDTVEHYLLRASDKEDERRKKWQNNRSDKDRDQVFSPFMRFPNDPKRWFRSLDRSGEPQMVCDTRPFSFYKNRLDLFAPFVQTWQSLHSIERGVKLEDSGLKDAFKEEVMKL